MTREEALKYLENSMAIGKDDNSIYHNEVIKCIIETLKDYDYTDELKNENKEIKKILDANTQKLAAYRDFIKLIGNMKACERFIDKEKAFDEIIKSLPDDNKPKLKALEPIDGNNDSYNCENWIP